MNQALQRFPVSTEQVMHPDRYPSDTPVPVDVPEGDADAPVDLGEIPAEVKG